MHQLEDEPPMTQVQIQLETYFSCTQTVDEHILQPFGCPFSHRGMFKAETILETQTP